MLKIMEMYRFLRYASNTGVINARLGKIFVGGGEKITLDFAGTGLMNIVVPTSRLENVKDINGNSLSSLVTNEGSLNANGGVVQLSGQTAENLMLGSVNIGTNGVVSATTVDQATGNIIIGGERNNLVGIEGKIDLSASTPSTPSILIFLVLMFIMAEIQMLVVQMVVKFLSQPKKCLFLIVL